MRITFRSVVVGATLAAVTLGAAAPAHAGSGWQLTGSMADPRRAHGEALLDDGRVLVASGFRNAGEVPGAEIYDPATGTWRAVAPPLVPRHYASTTKLPDGRVLLAGGMTATGVTPHAELYDPVANTWTATGPMAMSRNGHMAVLLDDGRVLVTGGADGARNVQTTAEIYTPATGTWSPAGTMTVGREHHQMTLLADGRVLVAGGFSSNPSLTFYAETEIYDPATDVWSPAASMATARAQMKGTLLPDGSVLAPIGINRASFVAGAERYDPATGTWAPAGSPGVTGNLGYGIGLRDGRFLLTADLSTQTPLYDFRKPAAEAWSVRYTSAVARSLSTLTLLPDGRVLHAGGSNFSSAEIFTPPTERGASGGDFGVVEPGEDVERDVTLSNDGGNPLWIEGADVTGDDAGDFLVVEDGCTDETLQPEETCVVRVRFTPSAFGASTAELAIDDNAETSPAVELTGELRVPEPVVIVDPPFELPSPPQLPAPNPVIPWEPAPTPPPTCTRRFVTLAGIAPTSSRGDRLRLSGAAATALAGKPVRIERNGRPIATTEVAGDGRIDATVTASKSDRARRADRYRLVVVDGARSRALKATRRVAAERTTRHTDGRVTVTGRIRDARRVVSLTLRSDAVCGPKTRKVVTRTDSRGRFRVTLPAPAAGSPATIHRLWWGTRSVSLPVVVTAGS